MVIRNHRLPHVTNISFKYVEGEGLMMGFNKNIAVSSGSACTSASIGAFLCVKSIGTWMMTWHIVRFGLVWDVLQQKKKLIIRLNRLALR